MSKHLLYFHTAHGNTFGHLHKSKINLYIKLAEGGEVGKPLDDHKKGLKIKYTL